MPRTHSDLSTFASRMFVTPTNELPCQQIVELLMEAGDKSYLTILVIDTKFAK